MTSMTDDPPEIFLVPVDGSPNAGAAARYAARLAEKLGARLRLLYAFPETPMAMFGVPRESGRLEDLKEFSPEGFEALRRDTARAAFEAARRAMGETSAPVEEEIISGPAGEAILSHASGVDRGMIVMGRRGLSRMVEILVGSTTQRVLHHAGCPILVIH